MLLKKMVAENLHFALVVTVAWERLAASELSLTGGVSGDGVSKVMVGGNFGGRCERAMCLSSEFKFSRIRPQHINFPGQ